MKKAEKKPEATPEKKKGFVTVNVPLLNVRIKPSLNADVVTQAKEGTELEKLGTVAKGTWIKVPEGYVMAEFVS